MFTLLLLYKRAPWIVKVLMVAVLFIVFVSAIVRSQKSIRQIQERQQHVHPRRSTR